ncbi:DUF4468 domain-containing protein [Hymenobacter sp. B81]|uniref:DUF4468 domain-containing protein n=1 Tax=Hymenobacter sp. B81 TaxID=3344878 RepID=UPI0037DC2963
MIRITICSILLLGVLLPKAHAQSEEYHPVAAGGAPLFRALKDTVKSPAYQLKPGEKLMLIEELSPRWYKVKRQGFEYFTPASSFAPGTRVPKSGESVVLPVDPATKLVTYTAVVQVPGASQNELYARGKVWFVNTFNSAKAVMQAEEKDAGLLIGKGWTGIVKKGALGIPMEEKLWYTVRLSVKEGRYKYEIYQFKTELPASSSNPTPEASAVESYLVREVKKGDPFYKLVMQGRAQVDAEATKLIESINKAMAQPATGGDW